MNEWLEESNMKSARVSALIEGWAALPLMRVAHAIYLLLDVIHIETEQRLRIQEALQTMIGEIFTDACSHMEEPWSSASLLKSLYDSYYTDHKLNSLVTLRQVWKVVHESKEILGLNKLLNDSPVQKIILQEMILQIRIYHLNSPPWQLVEGQLQRPRRDFIAELNDS